MGHKPFNTLYTPLVTQVRRSAIDTGGNADGIVLQTNDVDYPRRDKLTLMEAICDFEQIPQYVRFKVIQTYFFERLINRIDFIYYLIKIIPTSPSNNITFLTF